MRKEELCLHRYGKEYESIIHGLSTVGLETNNAICNIFILPNVSE